MRLKYNSETSYWVKRTNKSIKDISVSSKNLAHRAKEGTLTSQEYTGATFAISNLGMFDVSSFTAIIHPPQSAVLAVGTITDKPVIRNKQITIAQIMTATLSADGVLGLQSNSGSVNLNSDLKNS